MVSGGLLEREPELSRLRELVAAVVRAAGGLRIVEGEAGAGKTALLLAAAYDAREAGCEVLPARAGVFELTLGYGVARQLFEAHAGRTPLSAAILGPAAPPEPGS